MTRTVVHVSDSHVFGGTERSILQLLEGLDRRQWRCVLLHHSGAGSRLVEAAQALSIEHRPGKGPRDMRSLAQLPALVQQLRDIAPAVLHAHLTSPLACRFMIAAAAIARVPAIVATAQLFMEVPAGRAAAQHRMLAATVDRYIAVSADVAARLHDPLGVPANKIRIVHNAVAIDRFPDDQSAVLRREFTDGRERPVILTLARLDRQKGHRYLLEAAKQVPEALFVFAGEGPERASLQQAATRLGLCGRVRFLGDRTDVAALLASCDVAVLPSLYEGLPLAVLEAMAAGKPVIATAIGGTNEVVMHEETGLLVPPGDPQALAAAVARLIADPALAARLGANGRARVAARFHVNTMVRHVARVYEDVLG